MNKEAELKVHLSRDDLLYVRKRLMEEADAKVNRNIPETSEASDTIGKNNTSGQRPNSLNSLVQNHVHDFINEVLNMAGQGLIVEGQSFDEDDGINKLLKEAPEEAKIEPFDLELNEKLRAVYSQADVLTLEISRLRQQVPKLIKEKYLAEANLDVSEEPVESGTELEQDQDQEQNILISELQAQRKENIKKIEESQDKYYKAVKAIEQLKDDELPSAKLQVKCASDTVKFFS